MIVEAVLLDFANTVVQYDRPQMRRVLFVGDSWASDVVGEILARAEARA